VLSGRYRVVDKNVELRVELTEVRSGRIILAETLNDTIGAIVIGADDLVGQLVANIAAALLSHALGRVQSKPLSTLENHTLMLAAINLMNRTASEGLKRAHQLLTILAERVPAHPLPPAYLAFWHVIQTNQGWATDPQTEARLAQEWSSRALEADPNCSMAHTSSGWVHMHLLKRLDIAAKFEERALELNPNDSLAWLCKGAIHAIEGEGNRALTAAERALRLSPVDPRRSFYQSLAAGMANAAGKYERAIELASESLRVDRFFSSTYRALAIAQQLAGRTAEARKTVSELMKIEPNLTVRAYLKRHPVSGYALGKVYAEALRVAGVPE